MKTDANVCRQPAHGESGFHWFRIAVVYFVVAVLIGVGMGATGNLALYSVHSHLNLLGWESLALIGLIYHRLPATGANRLATVQFWLHNIGLPVMMLALGAKALGETRVEPVLAVSSTVVAGAVVLFAVNVLVRGSHEIARETRAGHRPDERARL